MLLVSSYINEGLNQKDAWLKGLELGKTPHTIPDMQ